MSYLFKRIRKPVYDKAQDGEVLNEQESKELNRLYNVWADADEKAEGSSEARRALAKYKDYEYSLKHKGAKIRFISTSRGIGVYYDK